MKSKFRKRLGLEQPRMAMPEAASGAVTLSPSPRRVDPLIGDVHPGRYPRHPDPFKGQVAGGVCNRTACNAGRAFWWNWGTYGFYCRLCASGINWRPDEPALCILLEEKPDLALMTVLHDNKGRLPAEGDRQ